VSRACPEPPPGTDARKRNPPEPKYRYEEDSPIGDSLAMAIGHMVQQWGHLEDNASILTALLLRAHRPYHFRGVATNLPTTSKFDALKKLTGGRNRIIHGSWYPTKNPDVAGRYTYSAKGELRQAYETVSAARVRGFAQKVAKLRRRLNHAISRQGFYRSPEQPPASP
jgi:hypothetical protein